MITETKRIRTKKGDPMMFATLDDLETSVEMIVFVVLLTIALVYVWRRGALEWK